MLQQIKKADILAFIIGIILSILSYLFYEKNLMFSFAIFLCTLLVYRRFIRNKKNRQNRKGEED